MEIGEDIQMKNKILLGINSFLLVVVLISLFLPIDSLYIYASRFHFAVC